MTCPSDCTTAATYVQVKVTVPYTPVGGPMAPLWIGVEEHLFEKQGLEVTAQFVGGTNFSGLPALVKLYRRWVPLLRRMKRSPGYRGHRVWYRFPFTFSASGSSESTSQ